MPSLTAEARPAVVVLALLAGCAARPLELSVDVRTDLSPGEDFAAVQVELVGAEPVVRPAAIDGSYARGVRVADFVGLAPGRARVRAALLDARGAELVARRVDLELTRDYAVTIALHAECIGRSCPGSAEPASFTECLSGQCVSPECAGPRPSGCGSLACARDVDCAGLGCGAICLERVCVCGAAESDAGAPDSGPPDAGPMDCPGECEPGALDEETRACGACGEGVERRTRTCGEDCKFGPFSSWSACATSAQCAPGETDRETRACGNCDRGSQSRTRTCDSTTCRWGAFSGWSTCVGGGTCAPGATRTGCDPCGVEVCTSSCTWGACQPAAGNECLRIRPGTTGPAGNNYRCCGSRRWQFCLDTCRWSTSCDACTSCC